MTWQGWQAVIRGLWRLGLQLPECPNSFRKITCAQIVEAQGHLREASTHLLAAGHQTREGTPQRSGGERKGSTPSNSLQAPSLPRHIAFAEACAVD